MRRLSRSVVINATQASGVGLFAFGVGAIYWQAGVIVLGAALAAVGYLHAGGDT